MSEVEISFHRKKFLCIRRNFLLQKETSCHGKEFHAIVRNFLSQEEISCQRQKCHVTGRNFLSQKETSCHRNKFHATVKKILSQEEIPKLPLFWTSFVASDSRCFGKKILAESIGSHEVKWFIPPWKGEKHVLNYEKWTGVEC